jgi:uncharacterized membrane protein YbhN (UPF0104 family)
VDRPTVFFPARRLAQWRGWTRLRPALTIALLLLGAVLLLRHLRSIDWHAVQAVLGEMPGSILLQAGGLSAASYAVYCSFDLLGQRVTGHTVGRRRLLAIAFVSHACALSLGPIGAGVRFRLLMRQGLPAHLTAALWMFDVATNWLGFLLVAGTAFAARAIALPASWRLGQDTLQVAGVLMLVAVAVYLAACRMARSHRAWTVRGVDFRLPSLHIAALQCVLSALNWLLLAGVVYMLLHGQATFGLVLGTVLANALALAVIDVPAGLGITDTVFLTLLGVAVAPTDVLAALLAYRAIYFLAPLGLASMAYLGLEWNAGGAGAPPASVQRRPQRPS